MQVHLQPSSDQSYWFAYGDDEPNLELLIAPLTPLVDDKCTEKGWSRPAQVNGRFHRQAPQGTFQTGPYMRAVFVECVKGWRQIDPTKPALVDERGQEIPYSEEAKRDLSCAHVGLVRTGFQLAQALGEISAEQIREERETFRRAHPVQSGVADPQLS
jgi:hypothetical protein